MEEAPYPDVSGAAAIDGTGTHLLVELCLKNGVNAASFVDQIIGVGHEDQPLGWIVNRDRAERAQMHLNYVGSRVKLLQKQFPGCLVTVESESQSNPGNIVGRSDWYGTADTTITVTNNKKKCEFLEVIDYKDGRGWVEEKDNPQLIGYLGGKVYEVVSGKAMMCQVTIVQPKTSRPIRSHSYTKDVVMEEIKKLGVAAKATDDPKALLVSGKHCQWCKHKPNCSAQADQSMRRISKMTDEVATTEGTTLFESLTSALTDIKAIDNGKLADIADARAAANAIFDRVDAEIQARIESGVPVDGYAMSPGRGSRKWNKDEADIVKLLKARRFKKDDIYPPKLVSPAVALKSDKLTAEQRKKLERDYVTYTEGALTLKKVARLTKETPEQMFAGVTEQPAQISFL